MKKKPSRIAKEIGIILINAGDGFIRRAFDLKPDIITNIDARKFLEKDFPKAKVILMDGKYNVVDIETWREIIELDTTDIQKYMKDHRDCENFSYIFKYNISRILQLPCCVVHGHVYDMNNKWLFGHFWNYIITRKDGKLKGYMYEPMTDELVEYTGKTIYLNNRKYVPLTIEY